MSDQECSTRTTCKICKQTVTAFTVLGRDEARLAFERNEDVKLFHLARFVGLDDHEWFIRKTDLLPKDVAELEQLFALEDPRQ